MNWNFSPAKSVHRLPAHLADLSRYLREISARVHASVVDALGSTVSRVVTDCLQRFWQRPFELESPRSTRVEPSCWREDEDWSDDEHWRDEDSSESDSIQRQSETSAESSVRLGLVAMCMRAAGWWLQRRGSWMQALGIGLGVGAVALNGGPLALAGLGLAEAASELIALNGLLSGGAAALTC